MTSWKRIDGGEGIMMRSYSFGPGLSNCVVVPGKDGLVAISPACKLDDKDFDALDGDVVGLVAPNGFHYLGMKSWKKRFPKARLFTSAVAEKRISKKEKTLAGKFESMDKLAEILPDNVDIFAAEHMKHPDVFARVRTDEGNVWYSNDVICNFAEAPDSIIVRLLFWATSTTTGYGINGLITSFFVKDKPGFKRWLIGELKENPPSTMIVGHGDVVTGDDLADRTIGIVEAI